MRNDPRGPGRWARFRERAGTGYPPIAAPATFSAITDDSRLASERYRDWQRPTLKQPGIAAAALRNGPSGRHGRTEETHKHSSYSLPLGLSRLCLTSHVILVEV